MNGQFLSAPILSTVIALAAGSPSIFGDDLERLGPKLAPLLPKVTNSASAAEDRALPAASSKPLVNQLKAIVLVPRPELVARKGDVPKMPDPKTPQTAGATPLAPLAQGPPN